MRRTGKIGIAASALVAVGVVTGGMLAVGQELDVDDNPGEQLELEGVETGVAAQDAAGGLSGARIRAEGTTPKVEEPVVVEQPVVDEVAPADPVVITPRRSAPAPAPAPKPKPAPAHAPKQEKGDGDKHWGDKHWGDNWGDKDWGDKDWGDKGDGPSGDDGDRDGGGRHGPGGGGPGGR